MHGPAADALHPALRSHPGPCMAVVAACARFVGRTVIMYDTTVDANAGFPGWRSVYRITSGGHRTLPPARQAQGG